MKATTSSGAQGFRMLDADLLLEARNHCGRSTRPTQLKSYIYTQILMTIVSTALSVASADDLISNSKLEFYGYCNKMSYTNNDCDCAFDASNQVMDDNISGRFALAFASHDEEGLRRLNIIIRKSDFYEGIHKFSLRDRQALLFERTLFLQNLLKRRCDLQLEIPKSER